MNSNTSSTEDKSNARAVGELADLITSGAVRLAAGTAAWLSLIAEFDRREGWAGAGILSCAHWLSWQCGLSPGPAREHVRVARALEHLPLTSAAFAEGRVSYSKVRAITRVADAGTEDWLLDVAFHATAGQLERVVAGWRLADRNDTLHKARLAGELVTAQQRCDWTWNPDGTLSLHARLGPEQGAAVVAALEGRVQRDDRRTRAAATAAQPVDARANDGVSEGTDRAPEKESTVERERLGLRRCAALTGLLEDGTGVARRPGDAPRREVVVHVDADVLADDAAAGRAAFEGGPALRPAQVRRMLCEAALTVVVEKNGQPLALGRTRRLATPAQRRALLARDGGCARPGCTETRPERLHAHHMRRWSFGGGTDTANLVLLCDVCHGLVHELDLTLTRVRTGTGRATTWDLLVHTPDGHRVWGPSDQVWRQGWGYDLAAEPDPAAPEEQTAVVTPLRPLLPTELPDAMITGGERMDLHHVVWVLMQHRNYVAKQRQDQRLAGLDAVAA